MTRRDTTLVPHRAAGQPCLMLDVRVLFVDGLDAPLCGAWGGRAGERERVWVWVGKIENKGLAPLRKRIEKGLN